MKDYTKYIIGFLLIFIGLILGLNAFGITNINLFFSGWWTLFIIIPSLVGLINDKEKTSSLIFLIIGVWLFLAERDLIEYELLIKLLLPVILISIGLLLVFKDVLSINGKEIKKIKELEYIYKEFYSNRRSLNYRIEIYAENEICKIQIYSEQEDTANDENPPECTEKWERDNKDIVDWLTKHNLFEGFDFVDYRWTKEFKFPYEYTNLYDLKEKLIKCLNEDVESIYSGE